MKYIIGFIIGVVVTSLYFMWQNRSSAAQLANQTAVVSEAPAAADQQVSNDFETFYERFHEDSLFQINHINFPLEGLPPQADSLTFETGYYWQLEDWKMQREIDTADGEFKRELSAFGNDMVIEQITHSTGQFGIQRRFARLGGEWKLIYYAALNRVAPQQ